ncbi:MAG: tetratricopeptide repeat protein [Xenococcus sp. (in: cyanobacteria)]
MNHWVERTAEINIIQSWLNNPQINTLGIQGLGGTGKSTIASYLYQKTDFAAKFWADVSLNPDFTIFAEKVITAFGGKVTQPIEVTQLINDLLALLSQRRCLLIIDNLETLIDEARNWQNDNYQQFFSRWLRQGTTSIILLTTRDKPQLFQGLQHWYSLEGMKIAEGISLLTKLGIVGTATELEDFVQYVDGHPLNIDLVAGYLREYCESQLSQVAELGLEQFEFAYQEASGAHRNQDARLSWIIQQHLQRLTTEQKNFLIDLSVYRLPFDPEAASYILAGRKQKTDLWNKLLFFKQWFQPQQEDGKIDIVKALQELCNRSLFTKTQDNQYLFQALVKEYLRQQEKRDLTIAHQQAIEYYRIHLKEKEYWQVLEDVSEYLEIIYHYCELEQYNLAKNVINVCYKFLDFRGYYSVKVEIYENLVPRWQENLQPKDRSAFTYCLVGLGNAYYFLGDYQQAINYYQRSLKIQKEISDHYGIAGSLMGLGVAYDSLGEYQKAIDFLQRSLEIQQEIGDRNGEAKSLGNLGIAYDSLGEYQRAIEFHQQSLKIQQEIGDRNGEAASLDNLGVAYYSLGEYQKAIDFHQQSLGIKQEIGDRNGEGLSLMNLGVAYNSLREYQRAIYFYQQSLEIQQQIGDRKGEGLSLMNLGVAYNSLGEYQRAIDFYQQSLEIQQQIGDRNGEAASWFNLGNTYKKLEQKSQAKTAYENARKLYQAMGLDKDVEKCNEAIKSLE